MDRLQSVGDCLVGLAQITGLVGAYLVLVEIALMARFPYLERRLGSWLASAHRNLGGYLILLLAAHVGLVVGAYSVSLREAPPVVVVGVLQTYPGVLAATVGFLVMVLAGFASARGCGGGWDTRAGMGFICCCIRLPRRRSGIS
ncbi:hypothetical protein ACFQ9X_28260 [Catenulispora yoronensis]